MMATSGSFGITAKGFGRVARHYIAHAAIAALAADGKMTGKDLAKAIKQYKIEVEG